MNYIEQLKQQESKTQKIEKEFNDYLQEEFNVKFKYSPVLSYIENDTYRYNMWSFKTIEESNKTGGCDILPTSEEEVLEKFRNEAKDKENIQRARAYMQRLLGIDDKG